MVAYGVFQPPARNGDKRTEFLEEVERDDGKAFQDGASEAQAQVQRAQVQPVSHLRPAARISAEI